MTAQAPGSALGGPVGAVTGGAPPPDDATYDERRTSFLTRFAANKPAVIGLVVLVLTVLAAVLAPVLAGHDPNTTDVSAVSRPPSAAHLLGTDASGRDVLSRLLHGAQVSLAIGTVAAVSAVAIGLVLGLAAGVLGGWVDTAVMRMVDVVLSFPALVPIILLVAVIGPSITTIIVVIAVFEWGTACRITRQLTLSVKEQDFVLGARALGAGNVWIMRKHIVRHVLAPLTVVVSMLSAGAIQLEAALSFLGLGVRPPQASWGGMLYDAQSLTILQSMPWMWLPPGLAIVITVLSINFLGDGLREALDPRANR